MKILGAFLAESAAVVDGKLDVAGGFLRHFRADFERVARVTLVVLARFEAGEDSPQLGIELITPSGDSQKTLVNMPQAAVAAGEAEDGFAFWPLWLPVEIDGNYTMSVTADDGSTTTLTLTVSGE